MPATVIRFQEDDDGGAVRFYLERPPGIANGKKLGKLKSRPDDADFQLTGEPPQLVKAGQRLREDLLGHGGIKAFLGPWLAQRDRPYQALYFQVDECPVADRLPWEALVDANNAFLALDTKCPIARVLSAEQQDRLATEVLFAPPLRLACVLGAWWEDGGGPEQQAEWRSVRDALASPGAAQLGVNVLVLGCDTALAAEVKATALPGVTVEWQPITGNSLDLLEQVRRFEPHIVHLYAHGVAGDPPYLEISNVADVDEGTAGTIQVSARQVRQDADPHARVWAVMLNACESSATGAMARDVSGLASDLVRYGFPAALGMRETVSTSEARTVARHFYEAAFRALAEIPPGETRPVEWGDFLRRVRLHLAGNEIKAATTKRWLLPVLYSRAEPFAVTRAAKTVAGLGAAERRQLTALREELIRQRDLALAMPISEDLKAQARAEFDAKIADVEARLG
jgi:hypothetical protein